jgi:hypothetical protein
MGPPAAERAHCGAAQHEPGGGTAVPSGAGGGAGAAGAGAGEAREQALPVLLGYSSDSDGSGGSDGSGAPGGPPKFESFF